MIFIIYFFYVSYGISAELDLANADRVVNWVIDHADGYFLSWRAAMSAGNLEGPVSGYATRTDVAPRPTM